MNGDIKTELKNIISFIVKTVQANNGIRDSMLKEMISEKFSISEERRFGIMGMIHSSNEVQCRPTDDGDIQYFIEKKKKSNRTFSNQEEQSIYEEICDSGAKGISKLELKSKLKLNVKLLTKVLDQLEKSRLIDSHKAIDKKKVIYVEAGVVPDEKVVGGNLYIDGEVDTDFVAKISENILLFVKEKKKVLYRDLLGFISSTKEGTDIDEDEAKLIINTLILDRKLLKHADSFEIFPQRSLGFDIEERLPCVGCPLFDACSTKGAVNPVSCVYFESW
mgnify:CR=1 FL=1